MDFVPLTLIIINYIDYPLCIFSYENDVFLYDPNDTESRGFSLRISAVEMNNGTFSVKDL